jgi:PhnB protein
MASGVDVGGLAQYSRVLSWSRGGSNMAVRAIPDGFHAVTPYLIVKGGAQAIEFYKKAFGAEERNRMPMPDGTIAHAELQLGDSVVMLADEAGAMGARSPKSLGGTPVGICLYVKDCDTVYHRALQAGATSQRAPKDQFYGDRSATVVDPFGHQWTISTHIEDVSPQEIGRRAQAEMSKK